MSYDCVCDYDQPTFCSRSTPRARKPHKCEECGGVIAVGERYEYVSGLWEGDFDTFKTCERCVDLRTWVENNVPCLCWAHGNCDEDLKTAVDEAIYRAPDETRGLRFGLLRRIAIRDKLNQQRRAADSADVPGEAFLTGHTWFCKPCQDALTAVNVNTFHIVK